MFWQNRSVDQRYWQVVVLVTRHDSTGSSGLILNRPSGYSLNKVQYSLNKVQYSLNKVQYLCTSGLSGFCPLSGPLSGPLGLSCSLHVPSEGLPGLFR